MEVLFLFVETKKVWVNWIVFEGVDYENKNDEEEKEGELTNIDEKYVCF